MRLDTSPEDTEKIVQIVSRVMADHASYGHPLDVQLDLAAVHLNDIPLNLDKLLAADRMTFLQDILGIKRNLDRYTGKLGNGFTPHCAKGK